LERDETRFDDAYERNFRCENTLSLAGDFAHADQAVYPSCGGRYSASVGTNSLV
jgi:hypothetical protein